MTDAALAALVAADASAESAAPAHRASVDLADRARVVLARVRDFAAWLAAMLLVEAMVLLVALAVAAAV